jgi:phosphatidylglycerol lysyltransferase
LGGSVTKLFGRWTCCADPKACNGTAHCLIAAGLVAAKAAGLRRFSLVAVATGATATERGPIARLGRYMAGDAIRGLEQFKASFAPHRQLHHTAAPSGPALGIGGIEL